MQEIILAHAVCNEFGGINNGEAGDQKQGNATEDWKGELRLQNFYMNKKGWRVLRPIDQDLAEAIARLGIEAVNNKYIGYSQNDRYSLSKNGVRTKKKCNCDCSTLVRQLVAEASGKDIPFFTTEDEVAVLSRTNLFQPAFNYVAGTSLFTGDVLVTKVKGHTATVAKGFPLDNPYLEPKVTVTTEAIAVKEGIQLFCCKGDPVRWVQYCLYKAGYRAEMDACGGIDGEYGKGTLSVVKKYQERHDLEVDGIVGKLTRASLKQECIW